MKSLSKFYAFLNRNVFKAFLKPSVFPISHTVAGKLFNILGAYTLNALLAKVLFLTYGTNSFLASVLFLKPPLL